MWSDRANLPKPSETIRGSDTTIRSSSLFTEVVTNNMIRSILMSYLTTFGSSNGRVSLVTPVLVAHLHRTGHEGSLNQLIWRAF